MKKKLAILFGIILVIALCAGISTHSAYAADIVAEGYCGGEGDGTNLNKDACTDIFPYQSNVEAYYRIR